MEMELFKNPWSSCPGGHLVSQNFSSTCLRLYHFKTDTVPFTFSCQNITKLSEKSTHQHFPNIKTKRSVSKKVEEKTRWTSSGWFISYLKIPTLVTVTEFESFYFQQKPSSYISMTRLWLTGLSKGFIGFHNSGYLNIKTEKFFETADLAFTAWNVLKLLIFHEEMKLF